MAEPVENAVHDLRLVLAEEGMGDIDIFGDDHAGRNVAAHEKFIGAGTQDRAEDGIDTGQPPAFGQLLIDHGIELALLAHHAFDKVAEECASAWQY